MKSILRYWKYFLWYSTPLETCCDYSLQCGLCLTSVFVCATSDLRGCFVWGYSYEATFCYEEKETHIPSALCYVSNHNGLKYFLEEHWHFLIVGFYISITYLIDPNGILIVSLLLNCSSDLKIFANSRPLVSSLQAFFSIIVNIS